MRAWAAAPAYWLTDNERTVSIDRVTGIAGRNPTLVAAAAGHCGITVDTCVPADAEIQGPRRSDGAGRQGGSGAHRRQPP